MDVVLRIWKILAMNMTKYMHMYYTNDSIMYFKILLIQHAWDQTGAGLSDIVDCQMVPIVT
jgi:hypothetical protein